MSEQRRDLIIGRTFGICSALGYATGSVLARQGVISLTSPLVGSAVALLTAGLVMGILAWRRPEKDLRNKKMGILFFFLAGLASGAGALLSFVALGVAPVAIVSPIQNTYPLFALFFAWIFLRRVERISLRLFMGAFFIVGGVALITLGKGA